MPLILVLLELFRSPSMFLMSPTSFEYFSSLADFFVGGIKIIVSILVSELTL